MKTNLITKFFKFSAGLGLVTTTGLYLTGNLDDARYLMGGLYRGMRCAYVGGKIANNYIRVIIIRYFILERNKPRNT
jgi:hypothetical protein